MEVFFFLAMGTNEIMLEMISECSITNVREGECAVPKSEEVVECHALGMCVGAGILCASSPCMPCFSILGQPDAAYRAVD
jgi:hypothetical protein